MPLSVNVSTGLVKGRFGSGVAYGPNGEEVLIPARGRIDFVGMTPFSSFPLATPDPVTMLRPEATGILDSEGYLCTPDPADRDKPGERMLLLQAENDPGSTVQGWTWRATMRFVNEKGTRVHNTLETITFDLPFGDVPFDLAHAVDVPESVGIGKDQAIIYAAAAQAAATSAAGSAEAAAEAARAVVGALPSKADLIDGKVPADQLPPAVGVTDEVVAPLMDMPETAAKIDARVAEQVAGKLDADTADATFQTKTAAEQPALGRLRAALTQSSLRPVRLVFTGSSSVEGYNATSTDRRFVNRLMVDIQRAYPSGATSEHPTVFPWDAPAVTPGAQGINAGMSGATASSYLSELRRTQIAEINPFAIFHMVGSNDYGYNTEPGQYKAQLKAVIADLNARMVRPPVHILIHALRRSDVTKPVFPYGDYRRAMEEIAAGDPGNVAFIDVSSVGEVNDITGADPLDLLDTDRIHPTDAGHAVIADTILGALSLRAPLAQSVQSAPAPSATVPSYPLVADYFTRADGGLGTAPTGQAWTTPSGAFAITGGKARATSGGTAVLDAGYSDVYVAASLIVTGELTAGIVARAVGDSSRVGAFLGVGGQLDIYVKYGAVNKFAHSVPSKSYRPGSPNLLAIKVKGDRVTVWLNGVQEMEYVLTAAELAGLNVPGNTFAGIRSGVATTHMWDNFFVQSV